MEFGFVHDLVEGGGGLYQYFVVVLLLYMDGNGRVRDKERGGVEKIGLLWCERCVVALRTN